MEIPRFEKSNINPRLITTDIGDAFQGFVHELLLLEHPQLHRFPGGGKDGGIDLIETSDTCFVVESKVVGEDDYAQIEQRWKVVRGHLEEHLSDPKGPTKGQSQYSPWYSTDTPIVQYVFSVSAAFANEQQRRDFRKEITDYFHNLAKRRPHLAHLGTLKITVIDWNDLCDRLRKRPRLIFRWFPASRPNGLVPLDEEVYVGTFRSYLNGAKLPYYSLAEHLRRTAAPKDVVILNEESLLARFERSDITGLVITGKGGIGKSRLMLELGWRALGERWTVMRVRGRLKDGALEELAEKLTPQTPALLLVDYIETQSDFLELVESLNLLNDSGVARLRYVAACRTGYYHQAIAAYGRHLAVDLSPPPGDVALDWLAKYRSETVGRILAKAGIAVTQQHVTACRDLPILAVFLAYLHTSGRTEDLAELLSEMEFGRWVARRVQLTFTAKDVSRDLALLVPLFPMADATATQLTSDRFRPVFDRLATDGWIERVTASVPSAFDEWVTAHDVLADQILLSYLRSIPNTSERFVAELFSLAAKLGCLSSAIVSLQRIADSPPLNALQWTRIITNAITENETAWRTIRDLVMRTPLLPVPDKIALLHGHEGLWRDAERDIEFHNRLGWLARWAFTTEEGRISEKDKEVLKLWISKALPFVERSNFVITWGLRLAPEIVQEPALRWISSRPVLFQTHYVMVAWLESGLPPQSIALFVQQWCQRFSNTFHLSFVAKAWLDAGWDKTVVEGAIMEWLAVNKTNAEAQFVFSAWLDAGGDKALVEGAIMEWLAVNKTNAEAQFVYNAWLDAGGNRALVEGPIKEWLGVHRTDEVGSHVYKAWLDAGGDKALVEGAINEWLGVHKTDAEASHAYSAWLDAGGDKALVEEAVSEWLRMHKTDADAQFIYKAWLDAGGDKALVQDAIKEWLLQHKTDADAQFIYKAWLDAGGDKALVQDAIKEWLLQHKTDAGAEFIYKAWLDAEGDKALVQDAIKEWLLQHKIDADAEFIYKAWLDAGGEKALVQEAISDWLLLHKTDTEAGFVYKAWLDAGGDRALVGGAIYEWLGVHETDAEADFVCRAWLDAGGDRGIVWDSLLKWLAKHRRDESAVYVTKVIARQPDIPPSTVKDVLEWCRTFPTNEDALWRLTQLGSNLLATGAAEDVVSTAEAVLEQLILAVSQLDAVTRGLITSLFSYLINLSEKNSGTLRNRVDSLFVAWLRHPLSFGNDVKPHHYVQRVFFLERLFVLLAAGFVDPVSDQESLKRFMGWLNTWEDKRKQLARPILEDLKERYPASGLWDIVQFEK